MVLCMQLSEIFEISESCFLQMRREQGDLKHHYHHTTAAPYLVPHITTSSTKGIHKYHL